MSSVVTRRALKFSALVLATTLAISACGHKRKVAETPTPTPTPTVSPTPTPSPTPIVAAVNPLTGIGKPQAGPIIAVKIDDTDNGRPPVNLNLADVVYIEQVEGGLTRLVAVFGTNKPTVEPVRSVRRSDPELLLQYGKIIVVASGGAPSVLPGVRASGVHLVTADDASVGFGRDYNRAMPYNLTVDLAQISKSFKGAGTHPVGFVWGMVDPRVGKAPAAQTINATVGNTAVNFSYDPPSKRYIRTEGGAPMHVASGGRVSAANVIVQFCDGYADPHDVDVVGSISHYTITIGSGRAVLFRNGHKIEGRWSRKSLYAPTIFTDAAGKPLLLQPGGAYVLLATKGAALS